MTSDPLKSLPLQKIAEDVFSLSTELRIAPAVKLVARMVVIRCGSEVWVHSPLSPTLEWYDAAATLGDVSVLVAPNALHHLFLGNAAERFPTALVCGPAKLKKKRKDLALGAELEDVVLERPRQWPAGIRAFRIEGAPFVSEFVFYHAASKSLLVTDLIFNLPGPPSTWLSRWIMRIFAGWKGPARGKEWSLLIRNKKAFAASIDPLRELDIERIIPCHGDPIEEDTDRTLDLIECGKIRKEPKLLSAPHD